MSLDSHIPGYPPPAVPTETHRRREVVRSIGGKGSTGRLYKLKILELTDIADVSGDPRIGQDKR